MLGDANNILTTKISISPFLLRLRGVPSYPRAPSYPTFPYTATVYEYTVTHIRRYY